MFAKNFILAGTALALANAAHAQSIDYHYDAASPFDTNSYYFSDSWVVGAVGFNDYAGTGGGSTYTTNPVGLYETTLTKGDGSTSIVYDFCSELFVGLSGNPTYSVTPGLSGLGSRATTLTSLLSNSIPLFLNQQAVGTYQDAATYAAAIQLGIWEIIQDGNPYLTLDDSATGGQALSVNLGLTDAGPSTDAVALAETWLAAVRSNTWTDQGNLNLYYADTTGQQDRIWVEVVPEPSSALLGLLGFGFVLRRRRR